MYRIARFDNFVSTSLAVGCSVSHFPDNPPESLPALGSYFEFLWNVLQELDCGVGVIIFAQPSLVDLNTESIK